jgi:protoheme IX farnesyltransferase
MHQMLLYTLILIAITVLPFAFGAFGLIYLVSASVLGGILLFGIIRMMLAKDWTAPAWWVYKYSLLYLALLFVAMAVDRKAG